MGVDIAVYQKPPPAKKKKVAKAAKAAAVPVGSKRPHKTMTVADVLSAKKRHKHVQKNTTNKDEKKEKAKTVEREEEDEEKEEELDEIEVEFGKRIACERLGSYSHLQEDRVKQVTLTIDWLAQRSKQNDPLQETAVACKKLLQSWLPLCAERNDITQHTSVYELIAMVDLTCLQYKRLAAVTTQERAMLDSLGILGVLDWCHHSDTGGKWTNEKCQRIFKWLKTIGIQKPNEDAFAEEEDYASAMMYCMFEKAVEHPDRYVLFC